MTEIITSICIGEVIGMEKNKGILDELKRIVGCLYISDLHDSCRFDQIKRALKEIEPGRYDDKEWREAFEYISGAKLLNETEEQVRGLFKDL